VIEPEDHVELAPGVELREGVLVDAVRALELPMNPTAQIVLARANGASIESIGKALAAAGAGDGLRDALAFCGELNERFLLNVRVGLEARLRRRARAFCYGIVLRMPARRVAAESPVAVARAVAPVGAILTALLLPLVLVGGAPALAASIGAGTGIVLHEFAHALALGGVRSAVVLHGLRPTVLHARLGVARTLVVAAAGPLLPSLTALAAAMLWRPSVLAAAPLGVHALGLTVLSPDGRNACGLS
jgi:hypothetical protein